MTHPRDEARRGDIMLPRAQGDRDERGWRPWSDPRQPVRKRFALTCEVCGGPVPFDDGAPDITVAACIACGAPHVLGSDHGCLLCETRHEYRLN
jgi:hypothetical protein